jgi:hypothetical protein
MFLTGSIIQSITGIGMSSNIGLKARYFSRFLVGAGVSFDVLKERLIEKPLCLNKQAGLHDVPFCRAAYC